MSIANVEFRNINTFREANRLTTELIRLDQALKAAQSSDNPEAATQAILQDLETAEKANQLQYYKSRFKKQTRKPDPHAPIDPITRKRKQYCTLNTFIRALIYKDLKAQNP